MSCSHFIQQSNLMFISTCMFGLVYRIIFSQVLCKCQNKKKVQAFSGDILETETKWLLCWEGYTGRGAENPNCSQNHPG